MATGACSDDLVATPASPATFVSYAQIGSRAKRDRGDEVARRMLQRLTSFYLVDVICDADLLPFYEGLGMRPYTRAILRNRNRLA